MKPVSKTILISGASTGIGYGAAKQFIHKGYAVFGRVCTQTDADRLQTELSANFVPLLFDMTDADAVNAAAQLLAVQPAGSGLGGLTINAGIAIDGSRQHQFIKVIRPKR